MNPQAIMDTPGSLSGQKMIEITPFTATLIKYHLKLVRKPVHTLQINLGFFCNQTCRHCHLDAGPDRKENMEAATVDSVVAYARRSRFEVIDITGGAPELNPHLPNLIEKMFPLTPRIMLRSNLSALRARMHQLIEPLKSNRVVIVASFPSLNVSQTDSQRGFYCEYRPIVHHSLYPG